MNVYRVCWFSAFRGAPGYSKPFFDPLDLDKELKFQRQRYPNQKHYVEAAMVEGNRCACGQEIHPLNDDYTRSTETQCLDCLRKKPSRYIITGNPAEWINLVFTTADTATYTTAQTF